LIKINEKLKRRLVFFNRIDYFVFKFLVEVNFILKLLELPFLPSIFLIQLNLAGKNRISYQHTMGFYFLATTNIGSHILTYDTTKF